jgi:hypothetical protein
MYWRIRKTFVWVIKFTFTHVFTGVRVRFKSFLHFLRKNSFVFKILLLGLFWQETREHKRTIRGGGRGEKGLEGVVVFRPKENNKN